MSSYFTPELFQFLTRLKRNNRRDWFQAHQEEWENDVRQPVLRFITDFAAPLYEVAPHLVADPRPSRGSMFRIYRDTRFSHDKQPYKTHVAIHFPPRQRRPLFPASVCPPEPGCAASPRPACGIQDPKTLLKVRNAIVSRPEEWRPVRKLLNWDDAGRARPPPRGFPADHEFVEDTQSSETREQP